MGQKAGKAIFVNEAKPFVNLPLAAMESLWEAFNDLADGFGLTNFEFKEIFAELIIELNYNRVKMDEKALDLFTIFDNDKNGLVDALEVLTTLSAISGMEMRETLEFIFNCYDFDGRQKLTVDEVTLAFKSTLSGLCKLSSHICPREEELELLAMDAFTADGKSDTEKIAIVDLIEFCCMNPETKSWIEYYDNTPEIIIGEYDEIDIEIDYQLEATFRDRDIYERATTEKDYFLMDYVDATEFMAAQPWTTTIKGLTPTDFSGAKPPTHAPEARLQLEWVHGYRGEDGKNNIRYTADGHIVYPAARLCIIYKPVDHSQEYIMAHDDDVVSIALHPEGRIVASGEVGYRPKICVWDSLTTKVFISLKGFHQRAVTQLAFSSDGTKLCSVGQDLYNSVAVYLWKENKILYSGRSTMNKVLHCIFGEGDRVVTCGLKHIFFWTQEGQGMIRKSGIFGRQARLQAVLSLISVQDNIISGTVSGNILVWSGRNVVKAVKGHMGSVNALYASSSGILSGGKDERIRIWTFGLEPGATFNVSAFGNCPSVRSVCMSVDGLKIIFGTKGCEIYEISAADGSDVHGGPVTIGHFTGKLCGLSVHPLKPEFATVGDDKTIRIWDIPTKSLVRMVTLDTPARALDYSPDGVLICAGLGADGCEDLYRKNGAYVVLNEADLTVVHEARDSKLPILEVKFAPDGETLAMSSADHGIYLYSPTEEYQIIARCRRHKAPVEHLDFSVDSDWIMSNCSGGEIMFLDSDKGNFHANVAALRDVEWITQNCTQSWSTQGVYPKDTDGSKIKCTEKSGTEETIIAGDTLGRIRMYCYPSFAKGPAYHEFSGHSNSVERIRFTMEDSHLISIGGDDRCVFQWKYEEEELEDDADIVDESESEGFIQDMKDGSDIERPVEHEAYVGDYKDLTEIDIDEINFEEFAAVKPWMEEVVPPSLGAEGNPSTPKDSLSLEWVHGYRGADSKNNLFYTSTGSVVYPCATLGVNMDIKNMTQRYNMEHTDDVISLAMHPDKEICASGQIGKVPKIVVWDATTGETLQVLQGFHRRAVNILKFSPCGQYLLSVGQDEDHSIAIYSWKDGVLRATTLGNKSKVLDATFHPDGKKILQVGVKHITFWDWSGKNFAFQRGFIGRQGKLQTFYSAIYVKNTPVVGTADGHLFIFDDFTVKKTIKAHDAGTYCLYNYGDGFLSGGKDGVIKKWNLDFECEASFLTLVASKLSVNPRVRSVCVSADQSRILCGTAGSEIFELNFANGSDIHKGPVLAGHFKDDLYALAVNPKNDEYATAGDDGIIRIYSAGKRKAVRHIVIDSSARALDYSPDGEMLAVGLGGNPKDIPGKKDGGFIVLKSSVLTFITESRDSKEWIRVAKFSPDGTILALGSQDNRIYMYLVKENFAKKAIVASHRDSISNFDFSFDSQYLQSADTAENLLYTDVPSAVHVKSNVALKDCEWSSYSLPIGYFVKGTAVGDYEGVKTTTVQRSHSKEIIAIGDNFGRIKLFNYPVHEKNFSHRDFKAHSDNVRKIVWDKDDKYLFSIGGSDRTVMQWIHNKDEMIESAEECGDSGEDEALEIDGGEGMKPMPVQLSEDAVDPNEPVKAWEKTMIPPSNILDEIDDPPLYMLELEYIHGYRAEDVRNSVRYNYQDDVLYNVAGCGAIFKSSNQTQSFHVGHKGNVSCLATSPDGKFAATGEIHGAPCVHIWDAFTGALIKEFPCVHQRGISAISFSNDGHYVAAVGQDKYHTVAIYQTCLGSWEDGQRVSLEKTTPKKVFALVWCSANNFPLMVCAKGEVQFLRREGKSLILQRGKFGARKRIQPVLCGVYLKVLDKVVTGQANGSVFVWDKNIAGKTIPHAHKRSCYAIGLCRLGFVTGGLDGNVKIWNKDLECEQTFNFRDVKPQPFSQSIYSVTANGPNTKLVVGMKGGEIYEISINSGKRILLTESHSKCELHGLCVNPANTDLYATIGDDAVLRVWTISARRIENRLKLDAGARAIAWSPDGERIIVGFGGDPTVMIKDGAYMVLNNKLEVLYEDRKSKHYIKDIKFSKNGQFFGIASADGKIYIHELRDYSCQSVCQKASGPPMGIDSFDFSLDAGTVQVATSNYELLYFDVAKGQQLQKVTKCRDMKWVTQTVKYGWTVQGIWPGEGIVDVQSVDRSNGQELLAVGLGEGAVRLYQWPLQGRGKPYIEGLGHAGNVSKVCFTADDSYLLTIGSHNRSIVQYKLVKTGEKKVEEDPFGDKDAF